MSSNNAAHWSQDIYSSLQKNAIRQVAYVPDAGHTRLIERCRDDASMIALPLTTEEEGVALLAGAWLGGERGVLLMQSSGVGNCINMLSLSSVCRLPLLMLVTMRGEDGETNPWQTPMGQNSEKLLNTAGVQTHRIDSAGQVGAIVDSAIEDSFHNDNAVAVLISQHLIGVKTFGK